jgi:hypothetical protein
LNVSDAKSPYTNHIKGKSTRDVRSLSPNIIGSFDANKGFIVDYTTGSSGAIKSHRVVQQDWNGTGSGGSNTGSGFDFNASWSNSIFGSANSVQVNSMRMLPCIKT